jgi:ATP/maltotriose-dependent transcriptional regulator MalT
MRSNLLIASGSRPSAVAVVSRFLLNDVDEIEDPFILVLDDYHNIHEKAVHDLMAAYMSHPPKSMHLMLLTRRDPPLLTSKLRGRGQVNEIHTFDLQFTAEETAVFLKNTLGLSIDGKTAVFIQDKLEGWPAGLRLISQSLKHSNDLDLLLASLKGGFAANDLPYAVNLVVQHHYNLMNREQWNRLERLLKILPTETVENNPILLMTRAFIYEHRGQLFESFAVRDQTESLLSTLPPESPEQESTYPARSVRWICSENKPQNHSD